MTERFVALKGYSNYLFGDKGSVFSKHKQHNMRPWLLNSNYYAIRLVDDDGISNRFLVHRLINKAFHGDSFKEGYVTNHIDGDKNNNNADNLEWISQQENILDMIKRVGDTTPIARKALAKSSLKPVAQFDLSGNRLNIFLSIQEAYVYLGKPKKSNAISKVLRGVNKTAYGYLWKYVYDEDFNKGKLKNIEKHQKIIVENRKKLKKIKQYDEKDNLIKTYDNSFTVKDTFKDLTANQITTAISHHKKLKGYYWSY